MIESAPGREATPAERLRWSREHAGYTQASDAARAMGVKIPTYIGHENGSRSFAPSAERYARFFHVALDWLLTGRGDPKGPGRAQLLYDSLSPALQAEALRYLEYLKSREEPPAPPRRRSIGGVQKFVEV